MERGREEGKKGWKKEKRKEKGRRKIGGREEACKRQVFII